jgi:RNA polymerase sigma-70 factor (ECF subfamily)
MMLTEPESRLFDEMLSYKDDVFRICLGFCRNASDAEDLAQDVYLRAYGNVGRIHSPYALKDWLLRVTRNVCLDHQKRKGVVRRFQERAASAASGPVGDPPADAAEAGERLEALKRAITALPGKLREVFVMRLYGDLSYEELARVLGLREGTVMSRLNRARTAVAEYLKEAGYE